MKTKLVFVLVLGLGLLRAHSSTADDTIAAEGQASSSNNTVAQDKAKDTGNNHAKETEALKTSKTGTPSGESNVNTDDDDTQTNPSPVTAANDQNAENVTGLSASLVDYVLDLLTHSNKSSDGAPTPGGKNATQPQAPERPAATGGDAGSRNMSPTETSGGGRQAGEGTWSSSTTGQEGRDAEDASTTTAPPKNKTPDTHKTEKGGDKGGHDQWSDNENFTTSKPISSHNTTTKRIKVDCNKKVDLRDYCDFTPLALEYFHSRTNVDGLRAPFIDMDIVYDLMSCSRGEWCLDNKLNVFKALLDNFYIGPMCDDSMWKCIFDIILLRENCRNDGEFLFVVDGMSLLCNLPSDNPPKPLTPSADKNRGRCFAHVLAALHVTYADFLANDSPEKDAPCEGHAFRMSETYLCADNNCKGQFEAKRAMEGFERWSWFMTNLDDRVENCKALASDTCGPLQGAALRPSSWFDVTTFTPFWMTTTEAQSGGEGAGKMNVFGEEDKPLMIALLVSTAVGLLFIVLGLLFWRRSRRRSAYYYRSLSDSLSDKGPSDEAHLLGRSTD